MHFISLRQCSEITRLAETKLLVPDIVPHPGRTQSDLTVRGSLVPYIFQWGTFSDSPDFPKNLHHSCGCLKWAVVDLAHLV